MEQHILLFLLQAQNSVIPASSGGAAIDITGVGVGTNHMFQQVGFVVDLTNKFVVANTFTDGIEVVYNVNGGAALGGLTDGTNYFNYKF